MSPIPQALSNRWSRREYLSDCWKHARQSRVVATVVFVSTAYSVFTTIQPLLDIKPLSIPVLPKLPLTWAAIIACAAIVFVAIEGGYRLRQEELAKLSEKPIFGIPQLAEGIRNYAQIRKQEKDAHYVLFDKSTLGKVLGDDLEKFDVVMEYLEKSGHARKHPNTPGSWFID